MQKYNIAGGKVNVFFVSLQAVANLHNSADRILSKNSGGTMITSMTGYGQCELTENGTTVSVELRSVNNRFLELSLRMPRELNHRENDVREIVRSIISRGKINLNLSIERATSAGKPVELDEGLVKSYSDALERVRHIAGIGSPVTLRDLLEFADEFMKSSDETDDDALWSLVSRTVTAATNALKQMRTNEGGQLQQDILQRIASIDRIVSTVEPLSLDRIPIEREKLRERVAELIDSERLDPMRLEFEITMLADKLDITEEIIRYRSHSKFFVEAVEGPEAAGRKLGFLLQEINREITTMGSKTNDAQIGQLVVGAKEELEKIREQVQNIE